MQNSKNSRRKPAITVCHSDHAKLTDLATAAEASAPEAADELLGELDRARIVADGSLPARIARIGSTVEYKPDTGDARTVTLVLPGQADIAAGRVSILTPIGTALIGLAAGQTISWTARDGRRHDLTVLAVGQPEPAKAERGLSQRAAVGGA